MADIIGRAVLEIGSDTKEIKATLEEMKKSLTDTGEHAKNVSELMSFEGIKEFAKQAGEAFIEVTKQLIELGSHGADVQDVTESFDQLAERAHTTGEDMRSALRAGVVGTISDFELMKMANAAMGNGLLKSAADAEALSNGARELGKRTGVDAKTAFETLTKAIETGRTSHLKQLGLFIDSKVATDNYAASIGKDASALTDHEKAVALSQAAMSKLKEEFKDRSPADFGEIVKQLVTRFENFRDQLSVAIANSPKLVAMLQSIAPAFAQAFGGDTQGLVTTVTHLAEDFGRFLITLARIAVGVADQIINAWTVLKVLFNSYMFLMVGGVELVVKWLENLVSLAAMMPGKLGAPFRAVKQSVTDIANELDGARKSFAQQNREAIDGAKAQKGALSNVDDALQKIGLAMDKAKESTGAATKAKHDYGKATSDAASMAVANAKKIAEEEQKLRAELELAGRVGIDRRLTEIENEKQKELLKAKELTGGVGAEYTRLTQLIEAKYKEQSAAAESGADEIRDKMRTLQNELGQMNASGLQARLLQLDIERQKEIAGIQNLKLRYSKEYNEIAALINQKYKQMSAAAQGHDLTVEQAAAKAGFKTREELQRTANVAVETYQRMKESGLFTTAEVRDAFIASENAKRAATGDTHKMQMDSDQAYLEGASQLLGTLGEKNKAAAIAGAIINTYMAVTKALAAAPWPANLVLAAGALAVGMENVSKIRSTKAYKTGTPGLDFADFGNVAPVDLHGQEAVVPRGRGHLLAAEIAAAMPQSAGMGAVVDRLDRLISLNSDLPHTMRRAMRDVRRPG